jgi:xylulokinase
MSSPAYLALDLGTSSLKGAVLHLDPPRLGPVAQRPFPSPLPGLPPLWVEVDPAAVVAEVQALLGALLPEAPNCAGLLLTGQMGGLVLTSETGQPLSNYISWRDQRLTLPPASGGLSYYDRLLQRLRPAHRRQLGHEVRPGTTLSFLFWLAQEGRLPAEAYAATLADFVAAHLCGAPPAADPTMPAGALNLETGDWHRETFARLGLRGLRWPALAPFTQPVGRLSLGGPTFPVYTPVGDHPCALLGAGLALGELSLNISTGSQVGLLTRRFQGGDYQTRPYFGSQFLNTITHIPAGRALNVLLGLLDEMPTAQGHPLADPWDYLHTAAESAPDTDLQVDLAFFPTPAGGQGAITNIREGSFTLGHLFRAAFRSMADNYLACALRLSPQREWNTLVFSGGLAQKLPLLRSMILERLPGPHRLSPVAEDTLTGLLTLALVIAGRAANAEAALTLIERR